MSGLTQAVRREAQEQVEAALGQIAGGLGRRLRRWYYACRLAQLGPRANFGLGFLVDNGAAIGIGADFFSQRQCLLLAADDGHITIGNRVSLGANVQVNASVGGSITLGDHTLVGPNVVLRASNHVIADRTRPIWQQGHTGGTIVIEEDVWLGANVVVLGGVMIGRGAVVAAGAVVTHNVEAYTLVGGVPARFIKQRGEVTLA